MTQESCGHGSDGGGNDGTHRDLRVVDVLMPRRVCLPQLGVSPTINRRPDVPKALSPRWLAALG
jgi:hypothetical protein